MSRFSRKSLRRPDAFQREALRAARWAAGRWPAITGVAALLVALLIGGAFWRVHAERRETEAAARLTAAVELFEGEGEAPGAGGDAGPASRAEAALPALREVAADYQGTDAGAVARLYVAHALLRSGKPKEAEEAYRAALGAVPGDLARQAARYGLGHAHLAQGEADEAVAAWRPLTETPGPYRRLVWYDLARAYEALGRTEEAREAYSRGMETVPAGTLAALAEARLAALGAPAGGAGEEAATPGGTPAESSSPSAR